MYTTYKETHLTVCVLTAFCLTNFQMQKHNAQNRPLCLLTGLYLGWQVRSAAEEYHAEFAAKESTIATLTAEAESARSHMQAEIDKLRSDMEVRTKLAL